MIPSIVDGSGQQSIGLDIAPAWVLQKYLHIPIRKSDYDKDPLKEIWFRTRIEFAATNGATSSTPSKVQASGLALGIVTSLTGSSDPNTTKLPGHQWNYFDECWHPQHLPKSPSLYDKITEVSAELLDKRQQQLGDLEKLVAGLQAIRHFGPASPNATIPMAEVLPLYVKAKPLLNSPKPIPADLQTAAPGPVAEAQTLADLQALFQHQADTATTPEAKQRAGDAVSELQGLLDDRGAKPTAPDSTPAAQSTSVASYLASMKSTDFASREVRRLSAIAGLSAAGAATGQGPDPAKLRAFVVSLATTDNIKALEKTDQALSKKFDSGPGVEAFQGAGIASGFATCTKATALIAAASPDVSVGLGYVEAGVPGSLSHLRQGGETVWLSGRLPLINNLKNLSPQDIAADSSKAWYVMGGGSLTFQMTP